MPTPVLTDKGWRKIDMFTVLPPDEGEMDCIYGRIGEGKTYTALRFIIADLLRGIVVYTNFKIDWKGYDQRRSKFMLILGILGLKRAFIDYANSNLHYVDLSMMNVNVIVDGKSTGKDFIAWVSELTDCKCYFDEAHIVYDSYEKTNASVDKRNTVLWTRHFDRSFVVITQRPSAIHVTLRANVNRFYKCHKTLDFRLFWIIPIKHFMIVEFQDTTNNDLPDERKVMKLNEETHMIEETHEYALAISVRYYWGLKKYFAMYDSKYRRMGIPSSQPNNARLFDVAYWDRWKLLFR